MSIAQAPAGKQVRQQSVPNLMEMNEEDLLDVQYLHDSYFGEHTLDISQLLMFKGYKGLMFKNEKRSVLGYAIYTLKDDIAVLDGKHGIVVSKPFRRQGIGSKLIAGVLSLHPTAKLLSVDLLNENVCQFLKKNGFDIPRPLVTATVFRSNPPKETS